jgi:hypothetical protein
MAVPLLCCRKGWYHLANYSLYRKASLENRFEWGSYNNNFSDTNDTNEAQYNKDSINMIRFHPHEEVALVGELSAYHLVRVFKCYIW